MNTVMLVPAWSWTLVVLCVLGYGLALLPPKASRLLAGMGLAVLTAVFIFVQCDFWICCVSWLCI